MTLGGIAPKTDWNTYRTSKNLSVVRCVFRWQGKRVSTMISMTSAMPPDNKGVQTSPSTETKNNLIDDLLLGACGVEFSGNDDTTTTCTTPATVVCGESMFQKVTTLFAGDSAADGDGEGEAGTSVPEVGATTKPVDSSTTAPDAQNGDNATENQSDEASVNSDKETEDPPSEATGNTAETKKKSSFFLKGILGSGGGNNTSPTATVDAAASPGENLSPQSQPKKRSLLSFGRFSKGSSSGGDSAPSPPELSTEAAQDEAAEEAVEENPPKDAEPDDDTSEANGDKAPQEEKDVHDMLAELEIPDFDDLSTGDADSPADIAVPNALAQASNPEKDLDSSEWEARMRREEVYSRRYHPSKSEQAELDQLAQVLGISKPSDFLGRMMGMGSNESLQRLLFGRHSILLYKTPVEYKGTACELLLLTDGFILKYKSINVYNPLEKRYEVCATWDNLDYCERASLLAVGIQLQGKNGPRYELEAVDDGVSVEALLKLLETPITQHDLVQGSEVTEQLGWQYCRIRKPGYTAAVTGNLQLLGRISHADQINSLDRYRKYAPLHYAVQQEEVSADVIQALLQMGADPNLPDGDQRTAMYYAERNELPEILEILQGGGGKKSKLAETEMRGALFAGVEAANAKNERRRELERVMKENEQAAKDQKAAEAQAKAQGAQSEMSKAMAALVERGEKIEQLDQKTKDLENEAKTFQDLAAQLKEQAKNKKWYQL